MTPEGKVKKEVKEFLDSLGEDCWYFCPMMFGYGKRGVPDIVGTYKGRLFGLEVKAPGREGTITSFQQQQLAAIRAAGGMALQVSSVAVLRRVWEKWFAL